MAVLDPLTRLSTDDHAVTTGVYGGQIVNDDACTDSPPRAVEGLAAGDDITIAGHDAHVGSYTQKVDGYPYRLTISPEYCGTVCSLYLTHRPYLLNICNGEVYAVDPEQVQL